MLKKFFIFLIRFYQKYISPMKRTKCPYCPTCSNYGLQAITKYGVIKGGCLTTWRLLRCNPFSRGGYDPVP
ncbi:membrane protein insertion efficiency factor YidD [Pseudobutyrivibrio sp. YE44]|uniref:membrane protein insertion efficiency factor YidD n=1 Tax=Pseudobutyrivibrio sp. YE44 TaxID=1520802 RepID=UPI0015A1C10B|nr:membrane protein insertion efficiency factor YidD [Pseudobutyrivibrio sp. YE44]